MARKTLSLSIAPLFLGDNLTTVFLGPLAPFDLGHDSLSNVKEKPRKTSELILSHPPTDHPSRTMEFIECTGKTLLDVVNEGEIDFKQLHDAGVTGDSIVRINKFGEIELRTKTEWRLVGGLIGNFEERLQKMTGLDWV